MERGGQQESLAFVGDEQRWAVNQHQQHPPVSHPLVLTHMQTRSRAYVHTPSLRLITHPLQPRSMFPTCGGPAHAIPELGEKVAAESEYPFHFLLLNVTKIERR